MTTEEEVMKKVYVLTRGSYSDYSIVGIFSTRGKADAFKNVINCVDGYNDLEEWELDSDAPNKIRRGYSIWTVLMLRNGRVQHVSRNKQPEWYDVYCVTKPPHIWKRTLYALVWAKTSTYAIKIANEYRAQFIANNQWPE